MRIAIVGWRFWRDREAVREYVRSLPAGTVVVSGGGGAVDLSAEAEAMRQGLQTVIHHAEWTKFGKAAGPLRNSLIVKDAEAVTAFWDGRSRGTFDTITKARAAGLPLEIHYPDGRIHREPGA